MTRDYAAEPYVRVAGEHGAAIDGGDQVFGCGDDIAPDETDERSTREPAGRVESLRAASDRPGAVSGGIAKGRLSKIGRSHFECTAMHPIDAP